MWAFLVACACPTFDEMVVTGEGEERDFADVEGALAAFAAWTAREGVCVPEIELRSDLPEPAWMAEGYAVGGQYRGARRSIRLASDPRNDLSDSTRHELCHALDHEEGHATAIVWPPLADRDFARNETHAVREDFALACAEEPGDVAMAAEIATRCGEDGEAARYLADVVFPAAPRVALIADDTSLDVTRQGWDGVAPDVEIADVVAYDGGLAIATLEPAGDGLDIVIRSVDADLAPRPGEARIEVGTSGVGARFIPADEGLYLVRGVALADGAWDQDLVSIDLVSGVVRELPVTVWPGAAAISGGVLLEANVQPPAGAWRLDGEPLATGLPDDLGFVSAIWPEGLGGFGLLADDELWRFAGSQWSSALTPGYGHAYVPLGSGRGLLVASWEQVTRVFLYDGGAFSFASDPCVEEDLAPWLTAVPAGDHAWEIERGTDRNLRYVARVEPR